MGKGSEVLIDCEILNTGITTDLFREEKDENTGFRVVRDMVLLGENILCFKTNSKHGWLFLY